MTGPGPPLDFATSMATLFNKLANPRIITAIMESNDSACNPKSQDGQDNQDFDQKTSKSSPHAPNAADILLGGTTNTPGNHVPPTSKHFYDHTQNFGQDFPSQVNGVSPTLEVIGPIPQTLQALNAMASPLGDATNMPGNLTPNYSFENTQHTGHDSLPQVARFPHEKDIMEVTGHNLNSSLAIAYARDSPPINGSMNPLGTYMRDRL